MVHKLIPLNPLFGVEITGLDPNTLSENDAAILRQAWLQHRVVVIRGYGLPEPALISLGRWFGKVENARKKSPLAGHPEIMIISNIRANGRELGSLPDGELYWHYDRIHQRIPNKAGILHAIQVPAHGGETRFADMCGAYDALPADIKRRIEGLTALNTYQYGQTRAEAKQLGGDSPSAVHPVVRRIPETGRKALYVCRLMTDRIMELDETASREILSLLFDHSERPEFVYEHTWRHDDLVIWDNRCVMHARNDFDERQQRLLKRVAVGDDQPPVP
jgi:taurine dioxygenase